MSAPAIDAFGGNGRSVSADQSVHARQRLSSIDILRGAVMIIMALDHARDFFYINGFSSDPTDLATTTPLLFFTRWITHFCAPVFVFLAGTGAYMQLSRGKSASELSKFLLTRGAWLILAEVTVVGFGWSFDVQFHLVFLQVIWTLGICMICLAAMIRFPLWLLVALGSALVAGHNLLDGVHPSPDSITDPLWGLLHSQRFYHLANHFDVVIWYPVLPWIGVILLGYAFGRLFNPEVSSARRRSILIRAGIAGILVFACLRGIDIYGDPKGWSAQSTWIYSLISFLNTTKYPPSLLFLLMTLSPSLLALAMLEGKSLAVLRPVRTFGRVPMFYYLVHIYLLHCIAWITMASEGFGWGAITAGVGTMHPAPDGFGFGIGGVYLFWFTTVLLLYPLCQWYDRFKSEHRQVTWTSYL